MAVPVPKGPGFGRTRRTRRTLGLSVAFVLYLVIGGVVFHFLETYSREVTAARPVAAWLPLLEYLQSGSTAERWQGPPWDQLRQTAVAQCREDDRQNVDELLESLHAAVQARRADQVEDWEEQEEGEKEGEEVLAPLHPPIGDTTLQQLLLLCGNSSYVLQSEQQDVPWSLIDAIFFCMTVVTTIGYGHISPKTPGGQIFCVVYSLLGIPISGLLLAGLSDFFAGNLLNFYDTKWAKRHGDSKWSLASFTALYLLVGFITFVFVPAIFFSWLEDWNYREAVYYAFITLSTIGFGDYTAGISDDTAWMSVYKVVIMIWILIGLGYWVLVLNFLQKTLKSKEVLNTLKSTSRLIAKEADELRATLAEVGLIHRDATFIPEHSKMALNMMLSMSRSLAGARPSGGGSEGEDGTVDPLAGLRGIHSIGDNMRSHGLLAALLSSMPPPPSSPTQTTTSTTLTPTSATAETSVSAAEDLLQGRINAGYLSEDDPSSERVTSPGPVSDRRLPTEPAGVAGPAVPATEPGSEREDGGEDVVVSPSEAVSPGCGV